MLKFFCSTNSITCTSQRSYIVVLAGAYGRGGIFQGRMGEREWIPSKKQILKKESKRNKRKKNKIKKNNQNDHNAIYKWGQNWQVFKSHPSSPIFLKSPPTQTFLGTPVGSKATVIVLNI